MQSSTKRLLSLVIVLAMALSMLPMMVFAETPSTLYVKPNANWLHLPLDCSAIHRKSSTDIFGFSISSPF